MSTIEFTLLVEPKSVQKGARAFVRGNGKIGFFNNSDKNSYQNRVILESKHHAPKEPLKGPLSVAYRFYLPRPKSVKGGWPHTARFDLSNLLKGTEDALTQAGFWKDDRQVVEVNMMKMYAEEGTPTRIQVSIKPL